MIEHLENNSIEWSIHYPTPLHRMPPYLRPGLDLPVTDQACEEILSIPVHEALAEHEVDQIIVTLNNCH